MTIARTPEKQASDQACHVNRTPAWDHKSLEKVGSVWMWQERKGECGAHTVVVCGPLTHTDPRISKESFHMVGAQEIVVQ